MKKMRYAEAIIDGYNAVTGAIVAVLSYILGEHWILFVAFLGLNIADWITGWMKSRMAGKENSSAGWRGVLKKLGYWLMIMVASVQAQYSLKLETASALIWESQRCSDGLCWPA